ncbi:MAG: relaxase, partial [Dactylosporangium sp.]|nr:relaxase [Dactylosporangium sp.]
VWEGPAGGPLSRAAELLDRAAHGRIPAPARRGSTGFALRSLARLVHATGGPGQHRHQRDIEALLQLIRAMAGLADALAELHAAKQRLHQADTARAAAQALRGYTPPIGDTGPVLLAPARISPGASPGVSRLRRHR